MQDIYLHKIGPLCSSHIYHWDLFVQRKLWYMGCDLFVQLKLCTTHWDLKEIPWGKKNCSHISLGWFVCQLEAMHQHDLKKIPWQERETETKNYHRISQDLDPQTETKMSFRTIWFLTWKTEFTNRNQYELRFNLINSILR